MSQSRAEQLQLAGRSYGRVWNDFVKCYAKNPDHLYCFFEGNDDPKYYGLRIDSHVFNREVSLRNNLCCKGKKNLIKLYELVINDFRYKDAWVGFFIDKDFDSQDDLPVHKSVYITPSYSIENLYLDEISFSKILRDEFKISAVDPCYSSTISLFINHLNEFNNASEELNAWIFLQRKKEKENPSNSKMNLKDLKFDKLFSVKISGVQKLYSIEYLNSFFDLAIPLSPTELENIIQNFKSSNRTEVFRGKYLIIFLLYLLKELVEDSNRRKNHQHFTCRNRVNLQLSQNIISELSQYAKTPDCLTNYLHELKSQRPHQLSLENI